MAFSQVIGQDRAIDILRGSMQRSRIASAYLFCGESGIGKKLVALNFAKALNCLSGSREESPLLAGFDGLAPHAAAPGADGGAPVDACETCASCEKINAGAHPDLLVIAPEERQIRIDEIRMVDEALSFRPFEGRRRVVIVDEADTMNPAASNAFLKTLEEPPSDSVIILVSSRPDRLLPTIRSRCSRVNFRTLSAADCAAVLRRAMQDAGVETAARLSMGRPGLAAAQDIAEDRDRFLGYFQAMLRAERDGWGSREEMERWFDHAAVLLRDLAALRTTGKKTVLINEDIAEQFGRMGKSVDLQGIIEIYQELLGLKGLLTFNPNKSITWNYAAALLRGRLTG
ncbi:MAG: DNA polymerase III subunit delta' [Thermodesulfovibrionales bacterium]